MEKNHRSRLMSIQQANFNELYKADSIIQLTIHSCQEREFAGQYYGATKEMKKKISEERNNYINMLTLLSERVSNMMDINLSMEGEILLEQHSDNCS